MTAVAVRPSAELSAAVDRILAADGSEFHPPLGCAIGVRSGGTTRVAVGGRRSPAGDQLTRQTSHDLASVTKVLATTTIAMRLVSTGDLAVDAPVSRHLPEFAEGSKAAATVRDLLQHRGGLAPWHPLYVIATTRRDTIHSAAGLPLAAAPRTQRIYSDLGFIILGGIVEQVSGLELPDALEQLVCAPLGLTSTRFAHPVDDDVAASADGDTIEMRMIETGVPYPVAVSTADFARWRHELVVGDVADGNAFHAAGGISGHAGLFSTIDDLLAFGGALSRYEENEPLWHPDVVSDFFAAGPDDAQALGFRRRSVLVDGEARTLLEHPGFVGCAVGFVPGADLAVAGCSNRLLGDATPRPTEWLWRHALDAAGIRTPGDPR